MKMHINYFKKDNLVSVHEWCHWQSLKLFNITLTKEKKKKEIVWVAVTFHIQSDLCSLHANWRYVFPSF